MRFNWMHIEFIDKSKKNIRVLLNKHVRSLLVFGKKNIAIYNNCFPNLVNRTLAKKFLTKVLSIKPVFFSSEKPVTNYEKVYSYIF